MKFALIIVASFFSTSVIADECLDICIETLGASGCPQGSYCKNNDVCQSLQWTNNARNEMCVFGVTENCPDRYPITCAEARTLLMTTTTASPTTTAELVTSVTERARNPERIINRANRTSRFNRVRAVRSGMPEFCVPIGTAVSCCPTDHADDHDDDDDDHDHHPESACNATRTREDRTHRANRTRGDRHDAHRAHHGHTHAAPLRVSLSDSALDIHTDDHADH